MTAIWYLMGLLLLAYMGSFLFGEHAIRGFGLPSSAEYVVLGVLLGPVLGLIERGQLQSFDALTGVGVGWVALVIGLDYGFVDGTRVSARSTVAGVLVTMLTGGALFGALSLLLAHFSPMSGPDRYLLAGGIAVACAETTRHAVRWVVERHGARGPLSRLVGELADADDMVVTLGSAVVFALHPPSQHDGAGLQLSAWGWMGVSIGLGLGLGGVMMLLLGREFRLDESWGLLLGTSMLAIGLTAKLGLSPMATMFVMGATISALSRHRIDIAAMTAPTERAVLLPALLLAGARIDLSSSPLLPAIIALTIVVRSAAKGLAGVGLLALPEARGARPWLGFGLISTGGLAMCIGLAFAMRFPGPIGDSVLATAAAVTVFGEFLGPATLRAVLRQAGELGVPDAAGAVAEPVGRHGQPTAAAADHEADS